MRSQILLMLLAVATSVVTFATDLRHRIVKTLLHGYIKLQK